METFDHLLQNVKNMQSLKGCRPGSYRLWHFTFK